MKSSQEKGVVMNGLLKFLLWLWLFAGLGLLRGLFDADVPFGTAASRGAPLIGIWAGVGVAVIAGLLLMNWMALRKERARLLGFVERRNYAWGQDLQLAAPEAYLLLNDGEVNPTEVFKAGILQAVAAGGLYVDSDNGTANEEEGTESEPSPASADLREVDAGVPIVGSVAVLTKNEDVRSGVKECVDRIKAEYGDPEGFIDREVAPRLVEKGYWADEVGLTESGRQAKAILEGRVGAALYDMQAQGGPSIDDDPWNALLAALVMVSTGMPMREAAEGANEVDRARIGEGLPMGDYAMSGLLGWVAFDAFDNIFSDIDSAVSDGGFDGGDGGDGDFGGGE